MLIFWLTFQTVFFLYSFLGNAKGPVSPTGLLIDLVGYVTKPLEVVIVVAGMSLCLLGYFLLRKVRGLDLWQQLLIATLVALTSAAAFGLSVKVACDLFDQP